jgi:hypothetical protein
MDINVISWADFKSVTDAKSLYYQYYDNGPNYSIWSVDGNVTYIYNIWKSGSEPLDSDAEQIEADRTDFETNYKPTANTSILKQQQVVGVTKANLGIRSWTFSQNLCDKTTWAAAATRVVAEAVGTGDGSTTEFTLAHPYVIDVVHGKISDEDLLAPSASQGGSDYELHVQVDGVTKTERTPFANSGGDYTVNYATGEITFAVAPASSKAITADYFYAGNSMNYVRPPTGGTLYVTMAEAQFSSDIELTTTLYSNLCAYDLNQGFPPNKYEYPGSRTSYKRFTDFVAYTMGSFPKIPAMGGTARGTQNEIYQLRFDYVSPIKLNDAYGMELRIWLENDIPYNGEFAQITFYGYIK